MQPFKPLIKQFDLFLNVSYPAAYGVLKDIEQKLDNTSEEYNLWIDYLSLKLNTYQYRNPHFDMVEALDQLQEMDGIDEELQIRFLMTYLFAAEKTFVPEIIEQVKSVIRELLSENSELSEVNRTRIELQLKMSEIRSKIFSTNKEKLEANKKLKELCQCFLDNKHYDLFYEEIGKLKNRTYREDEFVATIIEALENTDRRLAKHENAEMSLYVSLLHKHYADYGEDEIWKQKMHETLSLYQESNRSSSIEVFILRYHLNEYHRSSRETQSTIELDEMLELATELELRYYIGEFQVLLGKNYFKLENYEQAEYYLTQGIAIMETYVSVSSFDYLKLVEVKQHLKKYKQVATNLQKTISAEMTPPFYFSCGNEKSWLDSSIVSHLERLIDLYEEMDNIQVGIAYLQELVKQEYATDFNTVKSRAMILLAQLLHQSGELTKALECTMESAELAKNMGYTIQLVRSLNHTAIIYDSLGEIDQSLSYWKEAFLRYQYWIINTSAITDIIRYIDLFDKNEYNLDHDYWYHTKILETTDETEDPNLYIHSVANIAVINQIKGNWKNAIELWNEVYSFSVDHKVKYINVIALIRLAEIHHIQGMMIEFESYYRQAGNALIREIDSLSDWGWMYSSSDFLYVPIGKLTLLPEDNPHHGHTKTQQNDLVSSYRNLLTESRTLLKRFELKKAEERLLQSVSSDSDANKVYSYYLLSMLSLRKGELVDAKEFHENGLDLLQNIKIFGENDYQINTRDDLVEEYQKLKYKLDLMSSKSQFHTTS